MDQGEQPLPAATALNFTSNFPIPAPMKVSGDRINSWNFFRQQWEDFELATGQVKPFDSPHFAQLWGKIAWKYFLT
jgi:hypothetical protein